LPAEARPLPSQPVPLSVSQPVQTASAISSLDVHELFELPQPLSAAAAYLTAHAPGGLKLVGSGGGTGPGGTTFHEDTYAVLAVPRGIYAANLVLTIAPARSGRSLLRADAQVIWYPPRTAAEYIDPASYHLLDITVTQSNPRRTIRGVITSQAAITRLAAALNDSPARPVMRELCLLSAAGYTLTLAVSARTSPAVVISAASSPCMGARIQVGGRAQPPLQDEETVVAIADQLLGITAQP